MLVFTLFLICMSPVTYFFIVYRRGVTRYKLENEFFAEMMNNCILNGIMVNFNYENVTIKHLHTSDKFLVDSTSKISKADMRSRFRVYKINSNNYQTTIWDYDNTFLSFKNEQLMRKFTKKVKLAYENHMKNENIKKIERLKANLYGSVVE